MTLLATASLMQSGAIAGPTAASDANRVVAVVLDKKILIKDITPTEEEKKQEEEQNKKWPPAQIEHLQRLDRGYRIMGLVLPPIMAAYIRTNKIAVTDRELDEYAKAMQKTIAASPMASDPRMKDAWKRSPENDKMARDTIQTWKVGRALHRKYGGVVIFQQLNPVEPVGAYLKFLQQRERDGAIKFLDPKVAEDFWYYFKMDHGQWKVKDADPFDKPWWLENPSTP